MLWKTLQRLALFRGALGLWGTGLSVITSTLDANLTCLPPTLRAAIAAAYSVGTHYKAAATADTP